MHPQFTLFLHPFGQQSVLQNQLMILQTILDGADNPNVAFISLWESFMDSSKILSIRRTEKEGSFILCKA